MTSKYFYWFYIYEWKIASVWLYLHRGSIEEYMESAFREESQDRN